VARTEDDSWEITESVGATALGVAAARAAETESENPLISDPFARVFLDAAGHGMWNWFAAPDLPAEITEAESAPAPCEISCTPARVAQVPSCSTAAASKRASIARRLAADHRLPEEVSGFSDFIYCVNLIAVTLLTPARIIVDPSRKVRVVLPPELLDVLGGFGDVVGVLDLLLSQPTHLVHGELPAAVVLVDDALHFDEVVLLEGENEFFDVVPHLGFNLAGAIRQNQCQVGLTVFLCLHLLRSHHEAGGDDLVLLLRASGDKELFHEPPRSRGAASSAWRRYRYYTSGMPWYESGFHHRRLA